jgi:hypothetical protein
MNHVLAPSLRDSGCVLFEMPFPHATTPTTKTCRWGARRSAGLTNTAPTARGSWNPTHRKVRDGWGTGILGIPSFYKEERNAGPSTPIPFPFDKLRVRVRSLRMTANCCSLRRTAARMGHGHGHRASRKTHVARLRPNTGTPASDNAGFCGSDESARGTECALRSGVAGRSCHSGG